MRAKLRHVKDGWTPTRHGIPSSYNRGCRCDPCRASNAARHAIHGYVSSNRKRNFAGRVLVDGQLVHPAPAAGHGARNSYTGFGCRCAPCREANSVYTKAHRRQQRTGTAQRE